MRTPTAAVDLWGNSYHVSREGQRHPGLPSDCGRCGNPKTWDSEGNTR